MTDPTTDQRLITMLFDSFVLLRGEKSGKKRGCKQRMRKRKDTWKKIEN